MRIPPALIAWPLYILYRLWCATLRYTEVNRKAMEQLADHGKSVVVCLWHGELFPLIFLKRQLRVITVVSQSRDGEYLSGVVERMGLETARGSSSRGGVRALLHMARRMREDHLCACLTVDGPRGPQYQVKPGSLFLASKANAPIVPVRIHMEKAYTFKSWDHFQLPLPFSRVTMVYGDAWLPSCDVRDPDAVAQHCRMLEEQLHNLLPNEKVEHSRTE